MNGNNVSHTKFSRLDFEFISAFYHFEKVWGLLREIYYYGMHTSSVSFIDEINAFYVFNILYTYKL